MTRHGIDPMRRLLLRAAAAACGLGAFGAAAQPADRTPVGFRRIGQPQPAPADRIEVIEFFFYPCPFCHDLEALLPKWVAQQPADVLLRKVPVVARDTWAPFARLYYALEVLGEAGRLHAAVYRAIHVDRLMLGEAQVAIAWAAAQGIDRTRFASVLDSAEVSARVRRAEEMTADYEIRATPTLVVDGRWLTSSGLAQGVARLLPVVDRLIALVREERAGK
jgi:thiol:disulfide interchange protein DsbA